MLTKYVFALCIGAVLCACDAQGAASDPQGAAASDSRASVLTADQVVQILDETVDWYRTLGTQQQNATQPSDLLILFANRQTADRSWDWRSKSPGPMRNC